MQKSHYALADLNHLHEPSSSSGSLAYLSMSKLRLVLIYRQAHSISRLLPSPDKIPANNCGQPSARPSRSPKGKRTFISLLICALSAIIASRSRMWWSLSSISRLIWSGETNWDTCCNHLAICWSTAAGGIPSSLTNLSSIFGFTSCKASFCNKPWRRPTCWWNSPNKPRIIDSLLTI